MHSFFYELGAHGDLLSSPPRRSSDLERLRLSFDRSLPGERPACDRGRGRFRSRRSEEHTSELQSLAYLVCTLFSTNSAPTEIYSLPLPAALPISSASG